MIRLDVEANSPEWLMARLGLPTSSQFDKILTPAKLKLSAQRHDYRNRLISEWFLGYPIDWGGSSQFMDRGTEMEPRARAWYAFDRDVDVTPGGFCLRDDRRAGCSPDGLVGESGGLEIKCLAINNHIGAMLDPEAFAAEHRGQVQGSLYITGREWWDVCAYNPDLPAVVVRVEPDPEYHAALAEALDTFIAELAEARALLEPHRERMEVAA